MEQLGIELTLADKVSASANKAAAALRSVQVQADKAQKSLYFGGQIDKANAKLNALKVDPKGFQQLIKANQAIRDEKKRLEKATEGFGAGLKRGLFSWAAPYGGGRVWSNVAGELLAHAIMGAGSALVDAARRASEVLTNGFRAAMQRENTSLGFKLSLGSLGLGGKNSMADIGRFAGQTAFDDDEIAPLILQLRRSGMSQQAARTSFAIAGDLAAGQGRGNDLGAVAENADTLTSIFLKGGIAKKRLAGMGINTPEFYKALAKKLGTSVSGAEKLAESGGGKYSQQIINTIGETIEKQQGGKLGTGTIAAGKTMQAQLHKLGQLPDNYLKAIVDSPAWKKLSDKLGTVLSALDPDGPRGQKIIGSLTRAFEKLVNFIDKKLTPENIDKIADAASKFVDALAKAPQYLNTIVTVSEVLGTIWIGSKIASAISATSGALLLANPLLLATAAAVGSIALAIHQIDELGGFRQLADDIDYFTSKNKPAASKGTTAEQELGGKIDAGVASDDDRLTYAALKTLKAKTGKPNITVNVPNIAVNVTPAKDDTNHTGQKVGEEIHKHVVAAVGRAVQEMGH